MDDSDLKNKFRAVVEKIFNNWQNLRLAVEHGMGGQSGQKVAIDIMEYVFAYCTGNNNITIGELQDVMEDLMNQEFNTLCDDNSITEICRNLLRYKQLCIEGDFDRIEAELSKLQGKDWLRPDVKITYTPIAGESSSDEGASSSESDMDVDDEDDNTYKRITRSQTQKKKEEFIEPEPGWTTVRSKRN